MKTIKVALCDLKYYAFHGLYPQEKKTGNHFLVNIEVSYIVDTTAKLTEISQTVDYTVLNDIITRHMTQSYDLLESLIDDIVLEIESTYDFTDTIKISVKKLNPPFGGVCAASMVEVLKTK